LHPLDDKQSFMKASPPPIPFDQSCLVALNFLSTDLVSDWLVDLNVNEGLAVHVIPLPTQARETAAAPGGTVYP